MENLSNGQVSVKVNGISDNEIDLEFLPLIYEIIKSIERDPTLDTTQKAKESQDAALKILELEKKLNQAREQINRLPGVELSQEEQLKQVDSLRKQLALKRQLLSKYRNLCSFSIPKFIQKLSEFYPIRQAAKHLAVFLQKHNIGAGEGKFLEFKNIKIIEAMKKAKESFKK